jgi:16S rRNA (guanine1207-N2)-methyltransferase
MPSSLLPEPPTAQTESLEAVDAVLARFDPAWPQGHPTARLVEEYLLGRAHGILDVSGRPVPPSDDPADSASPGGASSVSTAAPGTGPVTVVLDDPTGALVLVAALTGAPVVDAWADSARAQEAIRAAVAHLPAPLQVVVTLHRQRQEALEAAQQEADRTSSEDEQRPPGIRVLVESPKQLAVIGQLLRDGADTAAEVVVAGRDKHLSPRLNSVLGEAFAEVHVSPGVRKSRLIIGVEPRSVVDAVEDDGGVDGGDADDEGFAFSMVASPVPGVPDLSVTARPGTFGGTSADAGAQLLVRALVDRLSAATLDAGYRRVLDLGCGNGWLLAALGALLPDAELWGVDDVRAAVASTEATVRNSPGVREQRDRRVVVVHADGTAPLPWAGTAGEEIAAGMFDLVTLNPPFHEGHVVTTDTAHALIDSASRLLAPGGRLVVVHNSHLRYRSHLERVLDDVQQWARDRRFTVLSGVARRA